jgi:putative nucleotidyltransferase with HDIG domain
MNRHQMIKEIEGLRDLPTLPTVAMEVNRMLKDVETPIEQLVALLEKDQAMVVKILRLVNSSFYGFKSKISSLRHAVTLMGYNTVQNAVVVVSVIDSLSISGRLKGFDITDFWTHSIRVAVMSRHLASLSKLSGPEDAFTAGLTHDIGKVVLVNHFPEIFVTLMESAAADGISFFDSEKQHGTYPHNLIGNVLARKWMLPESLVSAIRFHHSDAVHDVEALTGLVAVADTLVNLMNGMKGHRLEPESVPAVVRDPIIKILKDSSRWYAAVNREMTIACEFFNKR